VDSQSDARKEQKGRDEALALARAASKIVIARCKKTVTFDMRRAPPDDETLLTHLLGPTGNLRAPTLRKGATLLVGFGDEAYRELFGR
jgi:hypothetical protein